MIAYRCNPPPGLKCPSGWNYTNYSATIELEGPNGEKAGFGKPYGNEPIEWWNGQIEKAIKEAKKK